MHLDPYCLNKTHICRKVCISGNCQIANPFICDKCQNGHTKKCNIINYKKLVRQFHKIQGLFTQQILSYEQRVEQTFRQLMEGLQTQFIKFRQQFQYMHITNKIQKIYTKIKSKSEKQLTGSIIASALKQNRLVGAVLKCKDETQMRFQKKQILKIYNALLKNLPSYYSLNKNVQLQDIQSSNADNLIKDIAEQFLTRKRQASDLLKPLLTDFQKILGRQIYNIHLLYKATQNKFDAVRFHQKCDNIKNTLTVAKTEFGKIILGFCPFPWSSPNKWQYLQDSKDQCILFSASQRLRHKKFTPIKTKFAIGMHKDYGPCFGEDFIIYNKANNSKNCWSNFPDVYTCKKQPIPHNEMVIQQFIGVQDHFEKFNLVEWEVYKLSFSAEQQIEPRWKRKYDEIK